MVRHCAYKYDTFTNCTMFADLVYLYSGGNGGKGETTIRNILHIYPPIAMLSNAINSYLVFIPNVATIVHCKVGDNLDWNNIDTNAIFLNGKISTGLPTLNGCFSGWDTHLINHRGCGPRRCRQDTFGPTTYGLSHDKWRWFIFIDAEKKLVCNVYVKLPSNGVGGEGCYL